MIRKAKREDMHELVMMSLDLWKDETYNEMNLLYEALCENPKTEVLLYFDKREMAGFIQMSIREDYVEGANSSPVGYVEGIYVKSLYRNRGIAKQLVISGEQWAFSKGCTQIGSDVEQHNQSSYEFHKRIGFREANRLICFIKDI